MSTESDVTMHALRILVRDNGRFTDDAQYAVERDGENLYLRSVTRDEWSDDPTIMDVNTLLGFVVPNA